ncbi:MAG: recombinase family protein [Planctomycetota bacterium]
MSNGPTSETPEDELLVQFQGMIAEYERAQITERTRRGKLYRARSGSVSVLSGAPFGYRYIRKTDHAEARYEIVEREAVIVREAFRRFVEEQESISGLARWLREQRIRTPRDKTFWTRGALGRMLRNPAYCGRAAFGKSQRIDEPTKANRMGRQQGGRLAYPAVRRRSRDKWIEIPVPPIVSEEMFAQAARRLEDNKRFAARRTKAPSLLQGVAVCENCGYSYIRAASNSGAHRLYYYRCLGSDNFRFEHGRVCNSRMVRQDYLDALVWEHVAELLTQPQLIRTEIDRRLKQLQSTNPATAQNSHLEMELSRTTRAKGRLLQAYQEELLSLDELRVRMPELKKKESTLRAQLQSLDAQEVDREVYLALAENLEGFLARLRDGVKSTTAKDRQRILRLLVKEVLIGSDRILIRHSIPVGGTSPRSFRLCRRGLVAQPRVAEALMGPGLDQPLGDAHEQATQRAQGSREPRQLVLDVPGGVGARRLRLPDEVRSRCRRCLRFQL